MVDLDSPAWRILLDQRLETMKLTRFPKLILLAAMTVSGITSKSDTKQNATVPGQLFRTVISNSDFEQRL